MINPEKILEKYLPKSNDTVSQAMRYSLLSGGKRLRFHFVYAVAKQFGTLDSEVERIAVAVEMIHTYSLIHDDLPSMDDDDYRRGKPSCHKAFDEATAVLAGDALLTLAFSVLLGGRSSVRYNKAMQYIADCAGVNGMIHGQCLDIEQSPDWYETALNKTGKMFSAAIVAPALYLNVNKSTIKELSSYAKYYGLAFQTADDLSDNQVADTEKAKENLYKYLTAAKACLNKMHVSTGALVDFVKLIESI